MSTRIEDRYLCKDDQNHSYVVLKLRHFRTVTYGGQPQEVPTTFEYVLESLPPFRGVNVLKEGHTFQVVDNDLILRRVDGS
jgi:hypothetical protein